MKGEAGFCSKCKKDVIYHAGKRCRECYNAHQKIKSAKNRAEKRIKACSDCKEIKIIINNSYCAECSSIRDKKSADKRKDKISANKKIYYQNNKNEICAKKNIRDKENKEKVAKINRASRKKRRGKRNAAEAERHASKLNRTPKWITKEHKAEIKKIYILSKELQWLSEDVLTVDHILPLLGENVSGLHVPWNLQILGRDDNSKKNNSFDGTYNNNSRHNK